MGRERLHIALWTIPDRSLPTRLWRCHSETSLTFLPADPPDAGFVDGQHATPSPSATPFALRALAAHRSPAQRLHASRTRRPHRPSRRPTCLSSQLLTSAPVKRHPHPAIRLPQPPATRPRLVRTVRKRPCSRVGLAATSCSIRNCAAW